MSCKSGRGKVCVHHPCLQLLNLICIWNVPETGVSFSPLYDYDGQDLLSNVVKQGAYMQDMVQGGLCDLCYWCHRGLGLGVLQVLWQVPLWAIILHFEAHGQGNVLAQNVLLVVYIHQIVVYRGLVVCPQMSDAEDLQNCVVVVQIHEDLEIVLLAWPTFSLMTDPHLFCSL